MLVLLAVLGVFLGVRSLFRDDPAPPAPAVDYEPTLQAARQEASFPVLAPSVLPSGWTATSVRFTASPPLWHLGLKTLDHEYVGVEQAAASAQAMVRTYVDAQATRGGAVRVASRTWQTWTDTGGDTALVRKAGRTTVLVVGTTDRTALVRFAESLR